MRRLIIALLLGATACAPAANADLTVFEEFGLGGQWAEDCSKSAGIGNKHEVWKNAGGRVVLLTDDGSGNAFAQHVRSLEILPEHFVRFIASSARDEFDTMLLVESGKYRVWSLGLTGASLAHRPSTFFNTGVLVEDGKMLGEETRWYERCKE